MSISSYFSKDKNKKTKFIFNLIAPIYGRVDGAIVKSYNNSIELLKNEIDLTGLTVIDIGSGTGAWAAKFLTCNVKEVHGVDFSLKMINESKKRHPEIIFSLGDGKDLHSIKDNSFDLVTASYVIHGVKKEGRDKLLAEMKRISRKYVVVHDFMGETKLFARFLEFLENSDYQNFKRYFCKEMEVLFNNTKCISSGNGNGLYIATKHS